MSTADTDQRRAAYLRAVLAWHEVNQAELGTILGCTQVSASRKLRGIRKFSVDDVMAIAAHFGLSPMSILSPPETLEATLGPLVPASSRWTEVSSGHSVRACTVCLEPVGGRTFGGAHLGCVSRVLGGMAA